MVERRAPSFVWPNSASSALSSSPMMAVHAFGLGQDVEQVGDVGHHVAVLADDLVLLQPGQALQAHLQDLAGLVVGQAVQAIGLQAVLRRQPLGAEGLAAAQRAALPARSSISRTSVRVPAALHQRGARHRRRRRGLDDADELVDVGQRHRQAFQHMAALARLAQLVHGAAGHHLAAVLQEDRRAAASGCTGAADRRSARPC